MAAAELLQVALNGPLTKADYPAVAVSAAELARDAAVCVAAGARSVHVHPRDAAGVERLDGEVVDGVVRAVREACVTEVSVTTGTWIEPDLDRRLELIRSWREPDCATVNVSEEGSFAVMEALLAAGVGIEAGVWQVDDVEQLAKSGLVDRVARILVEPVERSAQEAVASLELVLGAADDRHSRPRPEEGSCNA
jgi:uncharacterized protein (DUF849 family)